MIEEHLQALKVSGDYSRATIESARAWLHHFQMFCGDRSPAELRTKDLEQWHKQLIWTPGPQGKLYAEGTVNQAVGAVRRLYRWGLASGKLQNDPTKTLFTPKAKKVRSQSFELKPSEKRKFLASLDPDSRFSIRDRAVLGILLETGISRPVCSRIDREHLCFDTGALLTKGRGQKIHSLTEGLLADLHRYLREARPLLVKDITPALFLNSHGNRLSPTSIQRLTTQARKIAIS